MKILKRSIALVLCAVMLLSMCACGKKKDESSSKDDNSNTQVQTVSYTDQPSAVTKSETVYVSIDSTGKTTATTVTDWLHTDKAKVKVYDKSDLADIKNVKTYADPVKEGDSIVWNMDTTDLYYTGTTTKEAPVSFDIKYSLDGKEMSAKDIAGKKGHVEVTITMKNNSRFAITKTFTDNLPVEVTLTDTCIEELKKNGYSVSENAPYIISKEIEIGGEETIELLLNCIIDTKKAKTIINTVKLGDLTSSASIMVEIEDISLEKEITSRYANYLNYNSSKKIFLFPLQKFLLIFTY